MQKVDVVILTKNSERRFAECLESVYENLPVNRLIVVDGYSTDATLEIVKKFQRKYGNVVLVMDRGTRGSARQKAIGCVRTEWFMFVDSDVVLCKDWFEKAKKVVRDNVGAVWGIEVWSVARNSGSLKMFLWVTRKIFEIRGGTHDTLIRFEAVNDIRIPKNLHVFEDAYISEWIKRKGYKIIACYEPYCIHYRPAEVWTLRGSINLVVDAFRCGGPKLIAKLLFAYGFYTAYSSYKILTNRMDKKR